MKGAKIVAVLLLAVMVMGVCGCVSSTNVTFNTETAGAEVYVDGELIGTTPATAKLSNAVWNDPDILIKQAGYQDLRTGVAKEFKPANAVIGLFLNAWAWLWCYGPKDQQNFVLTEK